MNKKIMIEGMSCQHCVNHVKEALSELPGIGAVEVDLANNLALVQAEKSLIDDSIKAAIANVGYIATSIENI
ncbi:MAG: heavy metal-associated domain-containing protein [Erysipelotrichaceae bacterium]|nr:heavy metal-associated domain-containing protein [Erysipelotrichaceae bacterium]MDD3810370.1 heavy metal-associated domain-containing protein [Erysipelotrichaceae bacterium]